MNTYPIYSQNDFQSIPTLDYPRTLILHVNGPYRIESYIHLFDRILCMGALPFCDYQWIISLHNQCVTYQKDFTFLSTGPVFHKDGKVYTISSPQVQSAQAKRANLNVRPYDAILSRLASSKFRSSFSLSQKDTTYIQTKGWPTIFHHAQDFIATRLAPEEIPNDGKQTPMRGHPVFVAQHATATCCRSCLEKWHHIPKHTQLSSSQQEYIVQVILHWIEKKSESSPL